MNLEVEVPCADVLALIPVILTPDARLIPAPKPLAGSMPCVSQRVKVMNVCVLPTTLATPMTFAIMTRVPLPRVDPIPIAV